MKTTIIIKLKLIANLMKIKLVQTQKLKKGTIISKGCFQQHNTRVLECLCCEIVACRGRLVVDFRSKVISCTERHPSCRIGIGILPRIRCFHFRLIQVRAGIRNFRCFHHPLIGSGSGSFSWALVLISSDFRSAQRSATQRVHFYHKPENNWGF